MFKKIMEILFDETEELIEEDNLNEEAYDIPSIKPIVEKPQAVKVAPKVEPVKSVPVSAVVKEDKVQPLSQEKPKSMMIDADGPKPVMEPAKELFVPKKGKSTPYQPITIISPIFGGPEKDPNEEIKPLTPPVQVKSREPMVKVISPMYGTVESKSTLGNIQADMLELDVDEMNSSTDMGLEIQASLYDMIEGLENEE